MKKFLAVMLVLVIAASLAACTATATKTIYVQTESVRTIGSNKIRMNYEYSSTGAPVSLKTYLNDKLYQTITYRVSGGLQYLTLTDSEGSSSTQCNETTYDEKGRVTQISTTIGGTDVSYTNYTYNDQDQVTMTVTVDAEATVNTYYTYDEQGHVISELQQNVNDGTYYRKDFVYNEKGYVIKESIYSAEDVLDEYMEISYTDDDSQKTTTYFNAEGEATGEVLVETFDEHGNKVLAITTVNGEEAMRMEITYTAMEVPAE